MPVDVVLSLLQNYRVHQCCGEWSAYLGVTGNVGRDHQATGQDDIAKVMSVCDAVDTDPVYVIDGEVTGQAHTDVFAIVTLQLFKAEIPHHKPFIILDEGFFACQPMVLATKGMGNLL